MSLQCNSPCVPSSDLAIKCSASLVFLQGTLPSVLLAFSSHYAFASRCCALQKTVDSSGAVKMFDAAVASAKLFAFGLFAAFAVAAVVAE